MPELALNGCCVAGTVLGSIIDNLHPSAYLAVCVHEYALLYSALYIYYNISF